MTLTEQDKINEALEIIDEILEGAEKVRKFPYGVGHEQLNLLYRLVKILTQEGVPRD